MYIWETFIIALSALLPMVNPVGSAFQFLALVGEAPGTTFRNLARRIAINNVIFLSLVEILGATILHFFGISIPIVEISGGIVICSLGWATLNTSGSSPTNEQASQTEPTPADTNEWKLSEKVFYPFTFPITSGPATVVTMLTLSAHVSQPNRTADVLGHVGIWLSILAVTICVYACYAYAPRLATAVKPGTLQGILRIISFITFSIGIQIAWNGLSTLIAHGTSVPRH